MPQVETQTQVETQFRIVKIGSEWEEVARFSVGKSASFQLFFDRYHRALREAGGDAEETEVLVQIAPQGDFVPLPSLVFETMKRLVADSR